VRSPPASRPRPRVAEPVGGPFFGSASQDRGRFNDAGAVEGIEHLIRHYDPDSFQVELDALFLACWHMRDWMAADSYSQPGRMLDGRTDPSFWATSRRQPNAGAARISERMSSAESIG
jgi:hypothetical protein